MWYLQCVFFVLLQVLIRLVCAFRLCHAQVHAHECHADLVPVVAGAAGILQWRRGRRVCERDADHAFARRSVARSRRARQYVGCGAATSARLDGGDRGGCVCGALCFAVEPCCCLLWQCNSFFRIYVYISK